MEGGREQNYWPGFVDALSNVVLTLVFVLVVFVFALVMASNKVEQKANELVRAAQEEKSPDKRVAEMKKQLEEAKQEIDKLKEEVKSREEKKPDVIEVDQELEKLAAKYPVKLEQSGNSVVLIYPPTVSILSEKAMAELEAALQKLIAKMGPSKIELKATVGRESYSAAHRLAYYRAMNLRNFVITKKLGAEIDVTSHIVKTQEPEDARVEIIFHPK